MNKEIDVLLQHFKDEIQRKFGQRILYASDCQLLSEQIQKTTSRQISVSTIKRFFGIVNSTFSTSKYTLNTFSIYLQYDSWLEFAGNFEIGHTQFLPLESWDTIKERFKSITGVSLKSIKSNIQSRFDIFPLRRFAKDKFEAFLTAQSMASAFIAPDGFGKSTIIAQLTERFFTGNDAKYPNDVVCLIDGSLLLSLLSNNQESNRLYNLIEYHQARGFSFGFRNHPELVKNRFVLIIDGIDDIDSKNGELSSFVDNFLVMLSSFENSGWFKVIISCSPNKWRMFSNRIQKNQKLRTFWTDVTFEGTEDEINNIPLLKRNEIKKILEQNHFPQNPDDLEFNYPDIFDIINFPYMLHLFLLTYEQNGIIPDIDLLKQHFTNTVLSPPYAENKLFIIVAFFKAVDYGRDGTEVRKVDLGLTSLSLIAYDELIRKGILYEYTVKDKSLSIITFVKFKDNILFAFYLANILIQENELNMDFLKHLIAGYSHVPNLLSNLIKFVVKILFREERVEILKNIFSIFDIYNLPADSQIMNLPSSILTNNISVEMRKNKKLRSYLIPYYAQSEVARRLYFERFFDLDSLVLYSGNDLNTHLQYTQSIGSKQYVCFMKFMQYFLSDDKENCKIEYEKSLNFSPPLKPGSFYASFYFIPKIIYQAVFEKKIDNRFLGEIYNMSNNLLRNRIQKRTGTPYFEFVIMFSLSYGRMNTEIINLASYIIKHYDLKNLKSSSFYQLFLATYGLALLQTGKQKEAFELYDRLNIRNINFPVNINYYFRLRLLLVKAEFLVCQGKLRKARQKLMKIKRIAKMLKFSYFYNSAIEIEKRIFTISDNV